MKINNDQIHDLHIVDKETWFRSAGCDNCNTGLGANVETCYAYFNKFTDYHTVHLCESCILRYFCDTPIKTDCQNIYQI